MAEVLKPCPCGHAGELNGTRGMYCTLKCPACGREASAFTVEGMVVAWNDEALPAKTPKTKRVLCDRRVDFESDHPGPFGNAVDSDGNELDEYANARTQEDWLLWLRAQAAAKPAELESRSAL